MSSLKTRRWLGFVAAGLIAASLVGCGGGSDGAAGPAGGTGATGPAGPAGPAGPSAGVAGVNVGSNTTPATAAAAAAWTTLAPQVTVTSVSINSAPVVNFKVTDAAGNPVVGLGSKSKSATATVANLTNIGFTLAKLVPGTNGAPSKWVSYLVSRPPTVAEAGGTVAATKSCDSTTKATVCGTYPTLDREGTLVDNKDGSYVYTFYRDPKQAAAQVASLIDSADGLSMKSELGDLSYDATLTHRLGILVYGVAPGTGNNLVDATTLAPVSGGPATANMIDTFNIGYDFVPAGGPVTTTRDIVVKGSCASCHDGKGIGHVSISNGNKIGRNDPRLCVTCHTDQTKYSFPEVTKTATGYSGGYYMVNGQSAFDYPRMIHQTHMGDELVKTGYNLNNHCNLTTGANLAQCYNTVRYPQDRRNCTTCHDGSDKKSDGSVNKNKTANGDNWMSVPSRLACGACHDGIDFATGNGVTLAGLTTGHVAGGYADDSACALCHSPTKTRPIDVSHRTAIASLNNATVQDGVSSFAYKITSATLNASKQAVVKFQILKNGTPVTLNTAPATTPLTGFTVGPNFMVIYATGQDGVAAPADWNSGHDSLTLLDAINGANGNVLTVADAATNTYQVTIVASTPSTRGTTTTPSHSMALPADAKMVTVFLKDSFTDPTVTENSGNLPGLPAMFTVTGNTPDGQPNVARRVIFSESKCNTCHDRLGTRPYFHNGNYSSAMCAACHTPNQGGSTGWSASFRVWAHGIHGSSKRTVPFTWHAVSATNTYAGINYPGTLKDCEQCHLPGTYDFSASQYTAIASNGTTIVDNMLNVQAATGKLNPASTSNYVFPQLAPVGSGLYTYGLKVDNTTDYGTGNSINPATGQLIAQTTQGNNLVSSPITAACSTCHDSDLATSHMKSNGGSFYTPRSVAVGTTETCLVCHGPGRIAAIKDVHQ